MIVYVYEGEIYPATSIDLDPVTGNPEVSGYERYDINNTITLTVDDCMEGYGSILQILLNTKQAKKA